MHNDKRKARAAWIDDQEAARALIERLALARVVGPMGQRVSARPAKSEVAIRRLFDAIDGARSHRSGARRLEAQINLIEAQLLRLGSTDWMDAAFMGRLHDVASDARDRLGHEARHWRAGAAQGAEASADGSAKTLGRAMDWLADQATACALSPMIWAGALSWAGHPALGVGVLAAVGADSLVGRVKRGRAEKRASALAAEWDAREGGAAEAFRSRYGFEWIGWCQASEQSEGALGLALAKLSLSMDEARERLGVEEGQMGLGAGFILMPDAEPAELGHGGYVGSQGGCQRLAVPAGASSGTIAHEWTHLMDAKLGKLAKEEARKNGQSDPLDMDEEFFSRMDARLKGQLPMANDGLELALAAAAGLPNSSWVAALAKWRDAELAELGEMWMKHVAHGKVVGHKERKAGQDLVWNQAVRAAWPDEPELWKDDLAEAKRASQRASARLGVEMDKDAHRDKWESWIVQHAPRLERLASTIDGSGQARGALPTEEAKGLFLAVAIRQGQKTGQNEAASYWADPAELIARMYGGPAKWSAKMSFGGLETSAWAPLSKSGMSMMAEGLAKMGQPLGLNLRYQQTTSDAAPMAMAQVVDMARRPALSAFAGLVGIKADGLRAQSPMDRVEPLIKAQKG